MVNQVNRAVLSLVRAWTSRSTSDSTVMFCMLSSRWELLLLYKVTNIFNDSKNIYVGSNLRYYAMNYKRFSCHNRGRTAKLPAAFHRVRTSILLLCYINYLALYFIQEYIF